MTQRTAILHIGTGKTGTTSIQRTLRDHRAALLQAGIAYPESPGETSHTRLGAFLEARAEGNRARLQLATGPTGAFGEALRQEIKSLPAQVHTVVFSSEHLYNRGTAPGAVEQLRDLLDPMFAAFRVIVYLRRQDELGVSRLSTRLKAGRSHAVAFPEQEKYRLPFDYAASLAPWIACFGQAAITPRLFARGDLIGGDVVRDFLETCGLPVLPSPPPETNTSLSPGALEFLRRMGAPLDDGEDGAAEAAWRAPLYLRSFLSERFAGRGLLPSRAAAVAFFGSFAASNEQVRAMFFPEREQLFTADFSRYPETAAEPGLEDLVEVALAVARMQSDRIGETEAQRFLAAARKAGERGKHDEMLRGYLKALEAQPTHAEALRELVAATRSAGDAGLVRQFLLGAPLSPTVKATIEAELMDRHGLPAPSPADDLRARRKAERVAQRKLAAGSGA